MASDSNNTNHKYQTRSKSNKLPKKVYNNESSDNDEEFDFEEKDYDEESSEEKDMEPEDFHQLLAELFPSKFSKEKAKLSKKMKKFNKSQEESTKNINPDNLIILPFPIANQPIDSDDDSDSDREEDEMSEDSSDESLENMSIEEIEKNEKILEKFKSLAKRLEKSNKDSKVLKSIQKENLKKEKLLKKTLNKNEKKRKRDNQKKLYKILNDQKIINEDNYFSKKLTLDEQEKVLEDLSQIKNYFNIEKPYLITLLDKQIPEKFKAIALNKINTLKQMSQDRSSSEYNKLKTWVDAFIKIPFEQYHSLPLTINDGIEKSNEFVTNAKEQLDKCVFGLNDAKLQILQLLGQWIVNPDAIGSAIAIHGPMGTGKTSLVRDGISKILNRPFAFIPLGGATDSSFLEGHGYTYEGSTYGKIVDILIQSKTMNPIIMFDELDKVSDTPKGEEIIGILTHLTDSTQNCEYHDKYFSELSFNLSKCLFIFSYNDESKINPILKDRLYKIKTKGYDKKDKVIIAENYLIPNIRETIKLDESLLKIPKNVLEYVIEKYCNDEQGVRNLKRNLEIIFTKLNLLRLLKDDNPLLKDQIKISQNFPITLDLESLEKLINKPESSLPPFGMYT
jgi:ATP-dependent Lon protease